eukprot:900229-Pleurochrysis_carterae.AAC.2
MAHQHHVDLGQLNPAAFDEPGTEAHDPSVLVVRRVIHLLADKHTPYSTSIIEQSSLDGCATCMELM